MADNVTFTANSSATLPAGTIVATDELSTVGGSTVHFQRVKLAAGQLGSTAAINSTNNALEVAIKSGQSSVTFSTASTLSALATLRNSGGTELGSTTADPSTTALGLVVRPVTSTVAPLNVGVIGAVPVTDNGGNLSIDDGGGSITIDGNSTAIISTASKIQVEPGAGAVFSISTGPVNVSESSVFIKGNSTAIISTASKIIADISTASKIQVEPGAGAVFAISTGPVNVSESSVFIKGNSTAIISTASKILAELAGGQSSVTIANSSASPVPVAGFAAAHSTAPSTFAAGALVQGRLNTHGVPWVMGGSPAVVSYEWASSVAATDQILLSSAATTRWAITQISAFVDEGITNGVGVRIGFSSGALPAASTTPVAGMLFSHGGIVPGGGAVRGDGSGLLGIGSTDQSLRITADASSGVGQTRVLFSAYAIPE